MYIGFIVRMTTTEYNSVAEKMNLDTFQSESAQRIIVGINGLRQSFTANPTTVSTM